MSDSNSNEVRPAARTAAKPLSGLSLIRVTGTDATDFLQGQLSNDLRRLTTGQAQLSSYNSPKGRMLSVLQLLRREDGEILLMLPHELLEATLKRLRMFVLRAKVQLADAGDACKVYGLAGVQSELALTAAGLPLPTTDWAAAESGGISIIRQPGVEPGFLLVAAAEPLPASLNTSSDEAWRLRQIVAGVPTVYPQTSDHFVAQMANLDLLGGISFDKGCYTGQEIVARLHYLGNLKRRMFLSGGAGPAPMPGTDVFEAGGTQPVGEIVDAVARAEGGFAAAVVLQLAHAGSIALHSGSAEGPTLMQPQAYPYPTAQPLETFGS